MVFFAHLLILEHPDHHQNLISSSLYYPGPLHKISSQSIHNLLSNVVHRQTDKLTNATKNITSFAKEVTIHLGCQIKTLCIGYNHDKHHLLRSYPIVNDYKTLHLSIVSAFTSIKATVARKY